MVGFSRAGKERVNAFRIEDRYYFKHFFETDPVFHRLKQYYNNSQYRFEVQADDLPQVKTFLAEHGYELVEIESLDEFVVVVKKYTSHPDNIFKASVLQGSVDEYNCFLIKNEVDHELLCNSGATALTDTNIEDPFG